MGAGFIYLESMYKWAENKLQRCSRSISGPLPWQLAILMDTRGAADTAAGAQAERAAHGPDGDKSPRVVSTPRKINVRIKVFLTSFKNTISCH